MVVVVEIRSVVHPYLDRFSVSFVLETGDLPVLVDTGLRSTSALLQQVAPKARAVLSTHGHWDHTGGHRLFQQLGAAVYGHPGDERLLRDRDFQWKLLYEQFATDFDIPPQRRTTYDQGVGDTCSLDETLADRQELTFGECRVQVLETPGHSTGSVCFYLPREEVLFTGDTVCGEGFFGGLPQINHLESYLYTLEQLGRLSPQVVYSAHHRSALDREEYRQLLEQGIACALRLREYTRQFLQEAAPGFSVGDVARFLCRQEDRSGGSGACITALACLESLKDRFPAAQTCCQGYLL